MVITVVCCAGPWIMKSMMGVKASPTSGHFKTVLHYLNTLAGGVVLGALMLHMIPELFHTGCGGNDHGHKHKHDHKHEHKHAHSHKHEHKHEHAHSHKPGHKHEHPHKHSHSHKSETPASQGLLSLISWNDHYSWGCLAAGISFLFLFYIDRVFFGPDGCHGDNHSVHEDHDVERRGKQSDHSEHSDHQDHSDHNHGSDCCHGHQGNGHTVTAGKVSGKGAKKSTIQLTGNGSVIIPLDISAGQSKQQQQEQKSTSGHGTQACHSHDLVGGCHMHTITAGSSAKQTMVFVFALSLHSLLEGLGAAGQSDYSGLMQFAVSLVGHKLLEAFALGVSVMRAGFSTTRTLALLAFYASLTPVGILLGMAMVEHVKMVSSSLMIDILNGAAVGSFMFVGLIEMIPPEFDVYDAVHTPRKFVVLCGGFMLMALINMLGHSH